MNRGMLVPSVPGVMSADDVVATAQSIADVQLSNGMIPWFPGGHADAWNHTEALMALGVAGMTEQAWRALEWLASTQHSDGSWYSYYVDGGVEDTRRDANICAYPAAGVWHHFLLTGDTGVLDEMWLTVERSIDFVLTLQESGGEITWSYEPDGRRGEFALLTSSSSIQLSLRCAIAIAERLGRERPHWELAAATLAHAVACRPDAFAPKHRWAMDWYYPVLSGVVTGPDARARLRARWSEFVMTGLGVRCVSDQPWVTAAETAECVIALDAAGMGREAAALFEWAQHLRHSDGSYWTGCVYPQAVHFPGGERSTYTAGAIILAADTLGGCGPASGFFRGTTLPAAIRVDPADEPALDA